MCSKVLAPNIRVLISVFPEEFKDSFNSMAVVEEIINYNILSTVDVIGQDAPEYATSDMSLYGGLQIGGEGAGTASEANFSAVTSISRTDPEMESKRKAYVSCVTGIFADFHWEA